MGWVLAVAGEGCGLGGFWLAPLTALGRAAPALAAGGQHRLIDLLVEAAWAGLLAAESRRAVGKGNASEVVRGVNAAIT